MGQELKNRTAKQRDVVASALGLIALVGFGLANVRPSKAQSERLPEVVHFKSRDGSTELLGYLFTPPKAPRGRVAAIVLMHGRAGPYSTLAHGVYDATTLSKRHATWGHYWAERGYVALLVDGFSPRGYPQGFSAHSYGDRPDAVNEVTVRPLDAYGALAYLRTRGDIDPERVALQGWSNGGSATLASMADTTLAGIGLEPRNGFKGALAFYPACGLHDRFKDHYRPYAPVLVFGGTDDEEVSAEHCARLVDMSRAEGGEITITIYPGATHDFDDPGRKRQSVPANMKATRDAVAQATAFMAKMLR
jgi:carboxymethylenebutenolidase